MGLGGGVGEEPFHWGAPRIWSLPPPHRGRDFPRLRTQPLTQKPLLQGEGPAHAEDLLIPHPVPWREGEQGREER